MKRCLNIGCGRNFTASTPEEIWVNLNDVAHPGVDVVRDARRGLPFSDGSFQHVLLDNVLEHFDQDDAIFLINEVDRVLAVDGTALIIVPHWMSQGSVQDPTHRSRWCERSALYWNQFTTSYGGTFVGITANFEVALRVTNGRGEKHVAPDPEFFIRYSCIKRAADYRPKVTP